MNSIERMATKFALSMKVWTISLKGQIPDEVHELFVRDVEEFLVALLGEKKDEPR